MVAFRAFTGKLLLALTLVVVGCSSPAVVEGSSSAGSQPLVATIPISSTSSSTPLSTSTSRPTTTLPTTTLPPTTSTIAEPTVPPLGTEFAVADGIELVTPSADIVLIGFHEANHDGSRQIDVRPGILPVLTLESRERGTQSRSAADVVVNPELPIYAPVTGTVLRAGEYTLYCDNRDSFVVIEPEGRPGIEVKVLHILANEVNAGDRVEAGVTQIAPGPTPLPFVSQVDEFTPEPSWPHVHIEVVDKSIPDIPNPGTSGSDC